jgi:branched-subunit amino acid ABC-type transport system permease component
MDLGIAVILAQDGVINGAIYALLGLAIVLVFSVTRVIMVPQGEFVTFGALTLAMLQAGRIPGTLWLLLAATLWVLGGLLIKLAIGKARFNSAYAADISKTIVPAIAALILVFGFDAPRRGLPMQILTTMILVVPLGSLLYRIVYAPLASSSILVLLIVSVAVHLALESMGLLFFGAEGFRTPALFDFSVDLGGLFVPGGAMSVVVVAATLMVLLSVGLGATIFGKALRATASNPVGARIVGIRPDRAGSIAFTIAAFVGVLCGLLIGPMTTIYYDGGFLIALKGFVSAIIGALSSYPLTVIGAISIGFCESIASFYASAFKDAIVFALTLPILLWLSFKIPHREEG